MQGVCGQEAGLEPAVPDQEKQACRKGAAAAAAAAAAAGGGGGGGGRVGCVEAA